MTPFQPLSRARFRAFLNRISFCEREDGKFALTIFPFGGMDGFMLGTYDTIERAAIELVKFAKMNQAAPGSAASSLGNPHFENLWNGVLQPRKTALEQLDITIDI